MGASVLDHRADQGRDQSYMSWLEIFGRKQYPADHAHINGRKWALGDGIHLDRKNMGSILVLHAPVQIDHLLPAQETLSIKITKAFLSTLGEKRRNQGW